MTSQPTLTGPDPIAKPRVAHLLEEGVAFMNLEGHRMRAPEKEDAPANDAKRRAPGREDFAVIVIGGGQAGLSVGYHLARHGVNFVILDAGERIGDSWRGRWDSLRLFTPAEFNGLDGMPFPAPRGSFPTKNEMADYLEAYAARFDLPVRSGVRVDGLARQGGRYVVTSGERRFESDQVILAMANYQQGRLPPFHRELDPAIVQLHSAEYRNASQLRDGAVLVVGAGNSGSEIAMEVVPDHPTWMSGRDTGHMPFRIDGFAGRHFLLRLVLRVAFQRVLTVGTPIGRKLRPKILSQGGPLIRVKPRDLAAAGVRRVGRMTGVRGGKPVMADDSVLDVANVVWCTGFRPDYSWIDLPGFGNDGVPAHDRGVVAGEPGFYFVGLHFLYALSSAMVHGVGRDARYIAGHAASRTVPREAAAG